MKTVLAAFIPLILAFLGYIVSARYKTASEFWESFLSWHKKLKAEITFSQRSLPEIFSGANDNDTFLAVAKEYLTYKTLNNKPDFLVKDEISFLEKYLENLGTSDKVSQLDFLNSVEGELENYRLLAEKKHKTFRPLYVKLGFLLGLIVFILIV